MLLRSTNWVFLCPLHSSKHLDVSISCSLLLVLTFLVPLVPSSIFYCFGGPYSLVAGSRGSCAAISITCFCSMVTASLCVFFRLSSCYIMLVLFVTVAFHGFYSLCFSGVLVAGVCLCPSCSSKHLHISISCSLLPLLLGLTFLVPLVPSFIFNCFGDPNSLLCSLLHSVSSR